jgi:predicted O-methyltransferase YrrM
MILKPKEYALIAAVFAGVLITGLVTAVLGRPWDFLLPLSVATALLCFFILLCYRHLAKHIVGSAEGQQKDLMVLYKQIEGSVWLASLIDVRQPLPSMRGMAISPDFAVLLARTIYSRKPKVIVELGCGTSTLLSSYILEQLGTGHVFSIDHDAHFAGICRGQLADHNLSGFADIYDCPLVPQQVDGSEYKYYDLSGIPLPESIDLLVVDGPPQWIQQNARYPALPLLHERLSSNAVILVDDAARPDDTAMTEHWLQHFPDFEKTYLPTEKGTVILSRRLAKSVHP